MEKRTDIDFIWEFSSHSKGDITFDEYGRTLYYRKWVVGFPTFDEVTSASVENCSAKTGYNLPLDGTMLIKRLWWDLTEVNYTFMRPRAEWIKVNIHPFLCWLRRNGYTGFSGTEPDEWKNC